jgi:calcineurin-like phosphoesterase family protein
MNNTLVNNINSVVKNKDVLWHLGDWAFGPKSLFHTYRERINCEDIRLIYGNHDKYIRKTPELRDMFTACYDYKEIRMGKTLVCMMHYPLGSWNEIGRGSINLFGHTHNSYSRTIGRQMDVGVDRHNFFPLNLEDLVDKMKKQDIVTVDHHDDETSYH